MPGEDLENRSLHEDGDPEAGLPAEDLLCLSPVPAGAQLIITARHGGRINVTVHYHAAAAPQQAAAPAPRKRRAAGRRSSDL